MHAFFALHFDPNSYKDVFLVLFTLDVKILYNLVSLFLELDDVTVGHICETFRKQKLILEI